MKPADTISEHVQQVLDAAASRPGACVVVSGGTGATSAVWVGGKKMGISHAEVDLVAGGTCTVKLTQPFGRAIALGEICASQEPAQDKTWGEPAPQNQPTATPVWEAVIADMQSRDQFGRSKYGVPLATNNGRKALKDLYEELLDAAVYCKQLLLEMEGK